MKVLGVLLLLVTLAGCNRNEILGHAFVQTNGHEHEYDLVREDDGHLYLECEDGTLWRFKSNDELNEEAWKKEHPNQ